MMNESVEVYRVLQPLLLQNLYMLFENVHVRILFCTLLYSMADQTVSRSKYVERSNMLLDVINISFLPFKQ